MTKETLEPIIPQDYRKITFYIPPDVLDKASQEPLLFQLLLTWTGCYIKAAGHVVKDRTLPDTVLIYCVEGAGWMALDGRRHIIRAGDVFYCPPGMQHSYGADEHEPWTKYFLHFRGSNTTAYTDLLRLTPDRPVLQIGDNSRITSMMHEIFQTLRTGYSLPNLSVVSAMAGSILSLLYSESKRKILGRAEDFSVEHITGFMREHLNGQLSLDRIARAANLSPYHFLRVFKKQTGYTPVDFFVRLKIQKACELLESSHVKVSTVGALLGFSSPYYFSMTFKRIMGQSPKFYREMAGSP